MPPLTFSRVLVLLAFGAATALAAIIFIEPDTITLAKGFAWLFVVLAVYLASLLVP